MTKQKPIKKPAYNCNCHKVILLLDCVHVYILQSIDTRKTYGVPRLDLILYLVPVAHQLYRLDTLYRSVAATRQPCLLLFCFWSLHSVCQLKVNFTSVLIHTGFVFAVLVFFSPSTRVVDICAGDLVVCIQSFALA